MDDDLVTKLLSAESDFLVAVERGALASYKQTWSQLLSVLLTASKAGGVGKEISCLVHTVASHILKIATCYMEIKHAEEDSTMRLRVDCDAMIQRMEDLDINAHPDSPRSDGSLDVGSSTLLPTPASDTGHSSAPLLTPAYRWLLDNLYNPYPTADVKKRLATSSSCQVSSINSWFTNTRRRIGWTALCRERFSNCRADMLDAAYRALVKEDPQLILSDEIRISFAMIKAEAESLYLSAFAMSSFAGDLVPVAKNITGSWAGKARSEKADHTKMARDPYPSPDRSTTGTPVAGLDHSPTDESEEEIFAPPTIAGSKRCRSSLEPVNQPFSASRPIKRLRVSKTPPTCLPSPPTSTDGTDILSVDGSPELSLVQPAQPETSVVSPSRERRLSNANTNDSSNRLYSTMVASHPHIVLDPQLCSNTNTEYSVDNWFNTNFDTLFAIPPPVEAAQLDSSVSWDVELFRDYSIPGNSKRLPDYAPAHSHVSAPTDFPDLDHLLQSIGEHTFVTPSETVAPSEVTVLRYSACPNSSIPDTSQINIDWASLLNEPHQPSIYPTFPQYTVDSQPLPDLDLSMLQLPPVIPTADRQTDIASKRAKLQQFHAMQEAVRQMERELQSEGVIA